MVQAHASAQSPITISQLYQYPIKSLPGLAVDSLTLTETGVANDRRFILVDSETQKMLTQRGHPQLATLTLEFVDPKTLRIAAPSGDEVRFTLREPPQDAKVMTVKVWSDTVQLAAIDPEVDAFFTRFLGEPVVLATNAPGFRRVRTKPVGTFTVGMADGYPLLICNEASLAKLNSQLDTPAVMERFRPNIVVTGPAAYAEDDWQDFIIGEGSEKGQGSQGALRLSKGDLCDRCVLINVDPATGQTAKEPLATLIRTRTIDKAARFGIRAIFHDAGTITKGQPVFRTALS